MREIYYPERIVHKLRADAWPCKDGQTPPLLVAHESVVSYQLIYNVQLLAILNYSVPVLDTGPQRNYPLLTFLWGKALFVVDMLGVFAIPCQARDRGILYLLLTQRK